MAASKTRICALKIPYASFEDAKYIAKSISNKHKTYLRPYQCQICKKFHLTKKPEV